MTVCWSLHWSDSWFPGSWRATASRVACSYGRGRRRTHRDFLPGKPAPCLRLKAHRLRAGLTQAEVAESLAALAWDHDQERLGVDANMVSKWERGITRPRKLYRRLLCSLYGATEQDLGLRSLPARRHARRRCPWRRCEPERVPEKRRSHGSRRRSPRAVGSHLLVHRQAQMQSRR